VATTLKGQDDEEPIIALYPTHGLVPEDERWYSLAASAAVRVQVGTADSGERHVEQGLISVGDFTREILNYETITTEPHERFHTSS
jgi:hypothetical protein